MCIVCIETVTAAVLITSMTCKVIKSKIDIKKLKGNVKKGDENVAKEWN